MNFKSARIFLTGFVVGAAVLTSTSSFAATAFEKITNAYINKSVKITVDGDNVNLTNKPITYNNVNYLPVAEVAKALGATTTWDKSNQTVNITKSTIESEVTPMEDNFTFAQEDGLKLPAINAEGKTFYQLGDGRNKYSIQPNSILYDGIKKEITIYDESHGVVMTIQVDAAYSASSTAFLYNSSVYLSDES